MCQTHQHHRNRRQWVAIRFIAMWGLAFAAATVNAADEPDDPLSAEATAPDNMVSLENTLGGSFFVEETLVEKADSLKNELRALKAKILAGDISATEATNQLDDLSKQLADTRERIQTQKVKVSAFNVYSKREEAVISTKDFGLLIVTGDAVRLRGWEGPGIKYVLEKTIVAKEQPDAAEFDAIRVKHSLGVQSEIVGLTREQSEQNEQEYLAAHPELTPEQLETRKAFVESIVNSNAMFEPFQGKICHAIELDGLKEGNKNLSIKIASAGGSTSHSSQWQRHASLTIFVPAMEQVCVRGCQVELDIQDIESNLVLTTSGSRDRDYSGSFVVSNIDGNVTIDQAPVRELTNIRGDVKFVATDEFVNKGSHHSRGLRMMSSHATASTKIRDVDGDLTFRALRTKLFVNQVSGKLDIMNEVGDTVLAAEYAASPDMLHRILSDCGSIVVSGPKEKLEAARVHAYTRCGRLHTNIRQETLKSTNFSTGSPRKGWTGLVPPSKSPFGFDHFDRPTAVIQNEKRKAGIDLISKAGEIQVLAE